MRLGHKPASADTNSTVVARAARAADAAASRDRGSTRFLMFVVAIVLAGTTTVGFAWAERQYDHPTMFDSWQNAYGIYDCQDDSWIDPLESLQNPNGIRTRGDGVIYIEPSTEAATGNNARLGLFLETVGVELSDDELRLPNGQVLSEQGASCGGEDAILQVVRFPQPIAEPDLADARTTDLNRTRFLADQEALVIALAPRDASVPLPASAAGLAARAVPPS